MVWFKIPVMATVPTDGDGQASCEKKLVLVTT